MATKLEALVSVDDGEPLHAVGSCTRTMIESIGFNPTYFREQGHLVTSWRWLISHDGPKPEHQPEEPKKKMRISAKTLSKIDKRLANWSKE